MKIMIINYGLGNLQSVANAVQVLGYDVKITDTPKELRMADKIILPGVGSFGEGMENLRSKGWVKAMEKEVIEKRKLFLGICLGMQLLATKGTEHGIRDGLNWVAGIADCMKSEHADFRLPHMGWNDVTFIKKDGLYKELGDTKDFYFVHSYTLVPKDKSIVSGVCNYFGEFAASIEKDNIFATQYHPEKSQKSGLKVLSNFLSMRGV